MPGAGAFLIQRLEGSRFGTVVLWVLNGSEDGKRNETSIDCAQAGKSACVRWLCTTGEADSR
jgi:hypothetical protein